MKPILFNDEMVRAILEWRKTQTRRLVTPQPHTEWYYDAYGNAEEAQFWRYGDREDWPWPSDCPLGQPGDRLWVREAWRIGAWEMDTESIAVDYRADASCRREWIRIGDDDGGEAFDKYLKQSTADAKAAGLSADEEGQYHWKAGESPCRWRPSIHMPRWASRITLEITDVRVERVQDISEEDAIAEGVVCPRLGTYGMNPETVFRDLWDSIAKPGALWRDNPWVWAISFKRVAP